MMTSRQRVTLRRGSHRICVDAQRSGHYESLGYRRVEKSPLVPLVTKTDTLVKALEDTAMIFESLEEVPETTGVVDGSAREQGETEAAEGPQGTILPETAEEPAVPEVSPESVRTKTVEEVAETDGTEAMVIAGVPESVWISENADSREGGLGCL